MSNMLNCEAVMFAFGKRITEDELAKILRLPIAEVKAQLVALQQKYSSPETALHLTQDQQFWKLTVKDQYLDLVKNIVVKTDLDRPTLETLAVIAFKYPVLQSEVIRVRNVSAYDHIKTLTELGYVVREKSGRSFKLKLTPQFFEYFDLPENKVKEVFADYEETAKVIANAQEGIKAAQEKEDVNKKILETKEEHHTLNKFE